MQQGRIAFSIGAVLGRTFLVWTRSIVSFTLLAVIVQSPLLIYTGWVLAGGLTEEEALLWDQVIPLGTQLLSPLVAGLVAYAVFKRLNGQEVGMGECIGVGLRKIVPIVLTGIIVVALTLIGLRLLVVPGIIFACMWWVAVPVAVVERTGVIGAMRRSYELTRGEKGSIFLIMLVLTLVLFAFALLFGFLSATMVDIEAPAPFMYGTVGLMIFFSVLQSVAVAVSYHDLRVSKEGVPTEDLVAVFA